MNHRKVPVERHHDESVDALVGRYVYDVLVDLAPPVPERPDGYGVADCREGNADDDEEEISNCKVDDEDVGRVSHLAIGSDNDDDEKISGQSDESDDRENGGNNRPNDVLETVGGAKVVVVVVVFRLAASGFVEDEFRRHRICCLTRGHRSIYVAPEQDSRSVQSRLSFIDLTAHEEK